MVPIQFRVNDHLIVPFACPKWEIDNIRIKGVSTDATFFETDTPVAYINRAIEEPLSLVDIHRVWPFEDWEHLQTDSWAEALKTILGTILEFGNLQTQAERKFVEAYFNYLGGSTADMVDPEEWSLHRDRYPGGDPDWIFRALLPLPQAHLYVLDPMEEFHSKHTPVPPKNMFKVDFVFWTGKQLVAIEIDGGSHIGSDKHVRKDRMLQRAGVQVVHILNSEIEAQPEKVIRHLLPDAVGHFWTYFRGRFPHNPLAPLPF
jgi:hypothetical protein